MKCNEPALSPGQQGCKCIFESFNSGQGQAVSLVDSLEQMSLKQKCGATDSIFINEKKENMMPPK